MLAGQAQGRPSGGPLANHLPLSSTECSRVPQHQFSIPITDPPQLHSLSGKECTAPEPQQRRSATPGLEQQRLGPRAPRSECLASNEDHVRAAGSLRLPGLAERLSGNVKRGGGSSALLSSWKNCAEKMGSWQGSRRPNPPRICLCM